MLIGEAFVYLGDRLFHLLLKNGLMLRNEEEMCDTFLHSHYGEVPLGLFLLDLFELAYVHGIEHWLLDLDLPWRVHVQRLCHSQSDVSVFSRVCSINPKTIVVCVIDKARHLKSACNGFLLDFGEASCLLLNLSVAGTCNKITNG